MRVCNNFAEASESIHSESGSGVSGEGEDGNIVTLLIRWHEAFHGIQQCAADRVRAAIAFSQQFHQSLGPELRIVLACAFFNTICAKQDGIAWLEYDAGFRVGHPGEHSESESGVFREDGMNGAVRLSQQRFGVSAVDETKGMRGRVNHAEDAGDKLIFRDEVCQQIVDAFHGECETRRSVSTSCSPISRPTQKSPLVTSITRSCSPLRNLR